MAEMPVTSFRELAKERPIAHMRKPEKRSPINLILAMIVIGCLIGIAAIAINALNKQPAAQAPPDVSVWEPVIVPTPDPTVEALPDVVRHASLPTRIQMPTLKKIPGMPDGFDSALLFPKGQASSISRWTRQMNDDEGGILRPRGDWSKTIVSDDTVPGGSLFGTDAEHGGVIAGHTTPNGWDPLGVFQHLKDLRIGDPIAITTAEGVSCYTVDYIDTKTLKKDAGKFRNGDDSWLLACYRTTEADNEATKYALAVRIKLDQQQTNTGSCWAGMTA